MSLHLGLDLLFLTGRAGGTETYTRELLAGMRRVSPDLRVTALVNRQTVAALPGWLDGAEVVGVPVDSGSRASWAVGELARVGRAAATAGVDVLHCPANFGPLSGSVPRVVTCHDLLHRRLPGLVPPAMRYAVRFLVDGAARRADVVVAVSEAAAADIRELLHVPADRVVVVPSGAPRLDADPVAPRLPQLLRRPSRPFVLSAGTGRPHKNLPRLIEALRLVPPGERPLLVLTGGPDVRATLEPVAVSHGVADDVMFAGWVDDGELAGLYRHATIYAAPSLFEGFGLPVLEAMTAGLAVACSDIPVLHEVAGPAADYFDPTDAASIAASLRRLLGDPARRTALQRAGTERAAQFTWDRAAEQTLAAYALALRR